MFICKAETKLEEEAGRWSVGKGAKGIKMKMEEERKDCEESWRIWGKVEKDEGKARGKWKNWKLRRKIKMRRGNVAGRHESEGCKEREGVGRRWDTLRVGREAEVEWRGIPRQASPTRHPPCFCRKNPMHAAGALSYFPLFQHSHHASTLSHMAWGQCVCQSPLLPEEFHAESFEEENL